MTPTDRPEYHRAQRAIEEAAHATEIEGQDLHSLSTCLMTASAALYAGLWGHDGPHGLRAALGGICDRLEARGEEQDARRAGPAGRA